MYFHAVFVERPTHLIHTTKTITNLRPSQNFGPGQIDA